jgi:prepilin-type N-terminal cleavage/methylation domain-containing protein
MRLHRNPARRRGGFTLVELLVVMAIIAVLVSLTTAAVVASYDRLSEAQCRSEITNLSGAIKQFQGDFNNPGPPPSVIWLDGSGPTAYQNAPTSAVPYTPAALQQLAIDSQAYLRKVWPHINIANGIPWNSGVQGRSNNVILEGEEALVFWLGGAQDPKTGAFLGFSADTTNPMNPNANIKRKGPYFQFPVARIGTSPTGSGFPMYFDSYASGTPAFPRDKPYAYFSSGKTANGYNAYAAATTNAPNYDCMSIGNFPAYAQPAGAGQAVQFYHPDTIQIISAGKNRAFGPGGFWSPLNPTAIGPAGVDDLTDFAQRKMGAPQ